VNIKNTMFLNVAEKIDQLALVTVLIDLCFISFLFDKKIGNLNPL